MVTPTEPEAAALRYDPFEFEEGRKNLRDEIVVTRKAHTCTICEDQIPAGSRARSTTDLHSDGSTRMVRTFHHCPICIVAEAATWDDGGEAFTKRLRWPFRCAGMTTFDEKGA